MEILQTILSSVTTIAALITAMAAIVAPIKTAHIQSETELKIKELDLFQTEKANAYKQLTEALGACRQNPTPYATSKLYEAISLAAVYSSDETARKLMLLSSHLCPDPADCKTLYSESIAAMRDELTEILENDCKVDRRKSHHKNC